MTRVAFLFPGQGAKRVHEALRFAARSEAGRARCEAAARAADVPLDRVIARPSLLDRTDVLQPLLTAIALAIVEALAEQGIEPDVVLGHSAGEIAAWAGAGGIAIEDAIELAALRGRLMAREAAAHPGGMAALATSDQAAIEAALAEGRKSGALCLAARNAPDETVLSGDEAAVRAVLAFAPALATRVPTSGAWHSPAMNGAVDEWSRALAAVPRGDPRCSLVANRTGEVATADGSLGSQSKSSVSLRGLRVSVVDDPFQVVAGRAIPDGTFIPEMNGRIGHPERSALTPGSDAIPSLLAEQLVRPVEWAKALATVRARADAIVTLGPGAVLRALWHRNFRSPPGDSAPGHESPSLERDGQPASARRPAGLTIALERGAALHPEEKRLLATDDERALGETIAVLRGLR